MKLESLLNCCRVSRGSLSGGGPKSNRESRVAFMSSKRIKKEVTKSWNGVDVVERDAGGIASLDHSRDRVFTEIIADRTSVPNQ